MLQRAPASATSQRSWNVVPAAAEGPPFAGRDEELARLEEMLDGARKDAGSCVELVGLKMKARDNLGVRAKSIGGETISYEDRGLPPSVQAMLAPYRKRSIG